MKLATDTKLVIAGGLVAVVALWYASKKAGQAFDVVAGAADEVLTAVNPVSDQNLAYRGVNALGSVAAGRDWNLGEEIYNWTHSKESGGYW